VLARELEAGPAWMYPWELGPGVDVPLLHPELPSIHATRVALIQSIVREALRAAGPEARALDLACSEGFFAQRLLGWGAGYVLGLDLRDVNVRRATVVRDHLGLDPERLEFGQADVFELDPDELGTFDVVLLLGLIYHVEDPVGAVRRARALTRTLCVIETQLTRQLAPIEHGWGTTGSVLTAEASFAARVEQDAAENPVASGVGVVSLIPNRAALELVVRAAGFRSCEFLDAAPPLNEQYVVGDRAVAIARP
jgi:tRNA (mo5U34)-methyltransferase